MSNDALVAFSQAAGALATGTFRVVTLEADGRVTTRDFADLASATAYADDAAAEPDVVSAIFDGDHRRVHSGQPYFAPSPFAQTPEPPYYAAIFTSVRREKEPADYERTAARMLALAPAQPGFLGVESSRDASGVGITVSYWSSLETIAAWRHHSEHALARSAGRTHFYAAYQLRIARVEKAVAFHAPHLDNPPPKAV